MYVFYICHTWILCEIKCIKNAHLWTIMLHSAGLPNGILRCRWLVPNGILRCRWLVIRCRCLGQHLQFLLASKWWTRNKNNLQQPQKNVLLLGNKQVSCHVWKFLPQNHPLFESFKLVFELKSSAASSRHIGPPFRASAKIPVKVINTSIHQACPVFPFFFAFWLFFRSFSLLQFKFEWKSFTNKPARL